MNGKVHIHLDRLLNNLNLIKAQLSNNEHVFAVIKDFAYGHGLVPIATFLEPNVYGFCVARVDEAVELRKEGIKKPILVFELPETDTARLFVEYSIIASVADVRTFSILEPGTEYHLNINTGMNRLGVCDEEIEIVKSWIEKRNDCFPTGIYTHFYKSDDPENSEVSTQIEKFNRIRSAFPDNWLAHASNSGGLFHFKNENAHQDAVRAGISLYGFAPGETSIIGLKPVLDLKSFISQTKKIKKGQVVSYGGRWAAPKEGFLATIPMGYNAGISRTLSGKIEVAICGKKYPQVGTISMDYLMVFLGEDEFPAGTEVELLGPNSMNAAEWAKLSNTISYEVITQLNWLIPRKYHN